MAVIMTQVQTSPPQETTSTREDNIVFFDGVCGLCNWTIDFCMKIDKNKRLRYAPLQGETAAERLDAETLANLNTLVFWKDQQKHIRSSAVVRILWAVGGGWAFLGWLLWIIPKPLRDLGYILVSKNRYRMFGKKETCRMPTAEERERILA